LALKRKGISVNLNNWCKKMKNKRIERLMTIGLILILTACAVQSVSTAVPPSIVSPPTASATIEPIILTPALSATLAPGQPVEYLEFSDLADAQAAATFSLWLPAFIPDDLGFYRAWVSNYADGSENVRILYAEPGDTLRDASRKMLDLQMTRTEEVISQEAITRQLKVNVQDVREVQVRGQMGFTYWTQSGAGGNFSVLTWREGKFNNRLSLFGDWPQPDDVNPHRLDDLLIEVAESLQTVSPTTAVTVQVMPPVSPTATPDCQPATGVTIEVRRLGDTTAVLHASGLQPGEIPFIFYSTSISGVGSIRRESYGFAKGADEHGEFSFELTGLQPLEGQARATWDIRLVHRRGVACTEITLP
jgi:hypothetical protein